jgi:hypothetical protein
MRFCGALLGHICTKPRNYPLIKHRREIKQDQWWSEIIYPEGKIYEYPAAH